MGLYKKGIYLELYLGRFFMSYKIVFFDVDGTITHHEDGSIPYSTIEAIKL
jgi:hypothetical protein